MGGKHYEPRPKQIMLSTIYSHTVGITLLGTQNQNVMLKIHSGFFSQDNAQRLEANEIEPYIACGRQSHNLTLEERLTTAPAPPENPDAITAMKHRFKTEVGKQFYAKRKSTVEPVFGLIKEVMGFRRFMLRGFEAVTGEWTMGLYCVQFEASLHPQCVNNRKSASHYQVGSDSNGT